ncbi:MAG: M20 family metallo-hydrolase, partial [Edaphobacter sp.]
MQFQINQTRLLSELNTLATITHSEPEDTGTAVTRIVFSADDLRARAWLKELALAENFQVRDDAVGNIFIRWLGSE